MLFGTSYATFEMSLFSLFFVLVAVISKIITTPVDRVKKPVSNVPRTSTWNAITERTFWEMSRKLILKRVNDFQTNSSRKHVSHGTPTSLISVVNYVRLVGSSRPVSGISLKF